MVTEASEKRKKEKQDEQVGHVIYFECHSLSVTLNPGLK